MVQAAPMIAALDDAGYRLTGRRREVAELIAAREGHFTAADLILDARSRRLAIGRATIFRALDLLTELKLLERLDLPEGEHAYVTCEPSHHHHVVCSSVRPCPGGRGPRAHRGAPGDRAPHRLRHRQPPPGALRPLPALPPAQPLMPRGGHRRRVPPRRIDDAQRESMMRHGRDVRLAVADPC